MDRMQALEELKARLSTPNLVKHSLAVEAIMREMAKHFHEDADLWGLAGLMHDIDYDRTANDPDRHGLIGAEILEDLGIDPAVVYSVKAHNERSGLKRQRKMDKALFCSDPASGLVTAAALIRPEKKLDPVTAEFLQNRFDEKGFARGASREQIKACEEMGLSLGEFLDMALRAMKGISQELGL